MALATQQLKEDLKEAYQLARGDEEAEASLEKYCDAVANAFEKYIKTAEVVYNTGLVAGANPVTGAFKHTIQ